MWLSSPSALLAIISFSALLTPALRGQSYAFSTLAGEPAYGTADGPGRDARFNRPQGVAVDGHGNVYVADSNNRTIRRIDANDTVTTVAGAAGRSLGPSGILSEDGIGSAARFGIPVGLAVDSADNLFVADQNGTIRRISADGVVTTLAGTANISSGVDGPGNIARFASPAGVAVDSSGNVYVADTANNSIRKITSSGVVTTFAGAPAGANVKDGSVDGLGTAARFFFPSGLVVDASGNLFVADTLNNTIRKITPDGLVTTLAGRADVSEGTSDGVGRAARFYYPTALALDGHGNLFVADLNNYTIRKVTADGVVTTLAGMPGARGSTDGTGNTARFSRPLGIAVDSSGNVFVGDSDNNTIRKITANGVVTTLAGSISSGSSGHADGVASAARFNDPEGTAVGVGGNVFVADKLNHTIRKITSDGLVVTLAGIAGIAGIAGSADGNGSVAKFSSPSGVAADGAGNVFIADAGNFTIRKITSSGAVTTLAGSSGVAGSVDGVGGAARFTQPSGVAVDKDGTVFVADGRTIRKISANGVVTTMAGSPVAGSFYGDYSDGPGTIARFTNVRGIAVDDGGNLFVSNFNTIRKITAGGLVTTVAGIFTGFPDPRGNFASAGSADGPVSAARFFGPVGVAVDRNGTLFVADKNNNLIRMITTDGIVTTLAGQVGSGGQSVDGSGGVARFNGPAGIAVDGSGNLFIADSANNTIRKGGSPANPARLTNVSILTALAGGETMTLGAIVGGAGARGIKPLLVRAVGPSLAAFGVTGLLDDPNLAFFTGLTKVGENDNWAGSPVTRLVSTQVGAFPLSSPTSKDAAVNLPVVAAGNNTMLVSASGSLGGIVLAELLNA